jgi:hypothetical protein
MHVFKNSILASLLVSFLSVSTAFAAAKTYTEDEFLDNFSGKSQEVVVKKLGAPVKKAYSVKPANAGAVIGKDVSNNQSKPVKVEMWYYKNLVRYEAKKTYKETELTFVNGKCMNVAFFNNR